MSRSRLRPAWLALLFGLSGLFARSEVQALSPPVGIAESTDILLAIGDRAQAGLLLVEGHPHLLHGSQSGYFEYAWFDGLSWRAHIVGSERLHAIEVMLHGGRLHAVALLSQGDGVPQLTYLAFAPRSGIPLRRVVLANGAVRSLHIAANEAASAPVVIAQYQSGSVRRFDNLDGQVNESALGELQGLHGLELLDVKRAPGGPLWIAYAAWPNAGSGIHALHVLGRNAAGASVIESVAPESLFSDPVAQLAIGNDGQPLLAYLERGNRQHWRRRSAAGLWQCPFAVAEDCRLAPQQDLLRASLSVVDDAGSGYVGVLGVRRSSNTESGGLWLRRLFMDGSHQDVLVAGPVGDRGHRVASLPPSTDLVLISQGGVQTGATLRNLVLNLPTEQVWRGYDTAHRVESGLALALDAAGEPVLLGDAGPGLGLRRSRWNPAQGRLDVNPLRPADERYGRSSALFAPDGRLHALATEAGSGLLYELEQAPDAPSATRTPLGVTVAPGSAAQLVRDADGALLALWQAPGNGIHLGRKPVGGVWDVVELPGPHAADARPQLAVSGTGVAFVSAYDPSARRIRVWQRVSADGAADFELRMQTDADAERPAHALAATRDDRPVLAYVRAEFPGELQRPAYRYPLTCCAPDAEIFDLGLPIDLPPSQAVEHLALALVDGSPSDARILLVHRNGALPGVGTQFARRTARQAADPFELTDLGSVSVADAASGFGLQATGTASYVAAANVARLQLLRHGDIGRLEGNELRRERLAPIHSDASAAPRAAEEYDDGWLIALCFCLLGGECVYGDEDRKSASDPAPTDLSARLRERFAETAEGRYYLALFAQHAVEMARLTLADPHFFAERITTFALFAPGLKAFVDGDGDRFRMSESMLRRAADVWQHYADQGSPALRTTIERELQRTGTLQRFAGATFDDWFLALPGEPSLFVDGFEAEAGP